MEALVMRNEETQALRRFDEVWRRVTEGRGAPPSGRPEGLMPRKERKVCCSRQKYCQRP